MKILVAILVFLIAAQPVGAGFCDMDASGGSPGQAAMTHHGATQGMDQHGGHDCCDTGRGDDTRTAPGCGHDMNCGSCVTGMSAVLAFHEPLAARLPAYRPVPTQSQLFTRHTAPPFRPPISVS
jgi:hypothetical protein